LESKKSKRKLHINALNGEIINETRS
jgi:hypothetical protein